MKISFAHCDNYYYPIYYLLNNTLNCEIVIPPTPTKKTIELGNKYSPESICLPFKYNLGNFIEALDNGADVIIHAGGGCKYGYYPEVQESILRDLGYNFRFYNLISRKVFSFKRVYKIFKELNPKLNKFYFIKNFIFISIMTYFIDKIENYIRINAVFIKDKIVFDKTKSSMLDVFMNTKSIFKLIFYYFVYKKIFYNIPKNKKNKHLKIGIIGELYTNMNSIANNNLENKLLDMNVSVKRFTNASYLLFFKKLFEPIILFKTRKFAKYNMGADAHDNVYRMFWLKKHKFDGVIHIKPSFCTPEIGVMSILEKVSNKIDLPIIFLTQDVHTTDEGFNTRIEAFIDMLYMRKDK